MATTGTSLADLENLKKDLPQDPYDVNDPRAVEVANTRLNRGLEIDSFYRLYFEREWFRNILFFAGRQWLIWDTGLRRYRPKNLPVWFPTPVGNKFAEKVNDIVSALAQGRPPINYFPATANAEDIATAEIAERNRDVLYEEAETEEFESELAAWLVLTGNVFLLPYYDYAPEFGTRELPLSQCAACGKIMEPTDVMKGACPACQGQTFGPAIGLDGAPMQKSFPIGAMRSDIISPFEFRTDPRIRRMSKQRWFARLNTYDIEFAQHRWKEFASKIQPDKEDKLSQFYLDSLAYVSTAFGGTAFSPSASSTDAKAPRATVYEYQEMPSDFFPEGARIIRVGKHGPIVELGPVPTRFGAGPRKGKPFLPPVHFGFDVVPGRFWRKTRMDDLANLQSYRNLIDAALKLTVKRTANSVWLNPIGSGVERITGEPGQQIDYTPVSLGGTTWAKPERVPPDLTGVGPLTGLKQVVDDEMEKIAGTFFVGSGDTPPGVTAASALAFLGERAERSMSPLKREYARGWKEWEWKSLEIFRANATDERFRVIAGKNKKWEMEKFSKADLSGAVNLRIDYRGLFPKSIATQRATIAQLVQLGVVNPQDPQQQFKILEAFGETALKGSEDIDRMEAVKEWDKFLEKNEPPILLPLVQNSIVHIMQHCDAAKTDEFKEMLAAEPERAQQWLNHIQAHYVDFISRQGQFPQVQRDPNQPAPDGGDGTDKRQARSQTGNNMGNEQRGGGLSGAPIAKGREAAVAGAEEPMPGQ